MLRTLCTPEVRWVEWLRSFRRPSPGSTASTSGAVLAALEQLPEEHRDLLLARFGAGRSITQIARAGHTSRAAVSLRQLLALRALQHELAAWAGSGPEAGVPGS